MGELGDAVVAEEVGVGEHGDAAGTVGRDRGERGVRRRRRGVGAGDDRGAVGGGDGPGAVEAGFGHAGEKVDARRLLAPPPAGWS